MKMRNGQRGRAKNLFTVISLTLETRFSPYETGNLLQNNSSVQYLHIQHTCDETLHCNLSFVYHFWSEDCSNFSKLLWETFSCRLCTQWHHLRSSVESVSNEDCHWSFWSSSYSSFSFPDLCDCIPMSPSRTFFTSILTP